MSKKEYFPNNWQEYKDSDDSSFPSHTFEEVMAYKVQGWELPSSVCCIIKVRDFDTGKISEHVYSRPSAAQKKIAALMGANCEFYLADHGKVHHIFQVDGNN